MNRGEPIRVTLDHRGELRGPFSRVDCTVVEVSGSGARVAVEGRIPSSPLTMRFAIAGKEMELPVTVRTARTDVPLPVSFVLPATEHFHRLIAEEQRRAARAELPAAVELLATRPMARLSSVAA